jgi:hypothetical protein
VNTGTRRAGRLRAERRTLDDLTAAAALVRLGVARRVIVCNRPHRVRPATLRAIAAHEHVAIDLIGRPDGADFDLAVRRGEPSS